MLTAPNITRYELRHVAGTIGAVLTLVAGIVLLLQAYFASYIFTPRGWVRSEADVIVRAQRGVREPAFSLLLRYYATHDDEDDDQEIRSMQIVPFEAYASLREGDTIPIWYRENDPFQWQLTEAYGQLDLGDYLLPILMIVISSLVLIFPSLIRFASREDDFVFDDTDIS